MARLFYFRTSTADQSVAAQRQALGGDFDREFVDEGVSGGVPALQRPAFAALASYARSGDTVSVYAVDRLGRDALDVLATVRFLMSKGVQVEVRGLGVIGGGVGELILAVLAQVAEMERQRIRERCASGQNAARSALAATGRTHRGKLSMGRPFAHEAAEVSKWRRDNSASIAATARQFSISPSTVKRYCGVA